jgi:hypothetical protein
MLPKPHGKYGYTAEQITEICKERNITEKAFWASFGRNTVAVVKGKENYYPCDVEKALFNLGVEDGKWHPWD